MRNVVTFCQLWYNSNKCLHENCCKTPTTIVLVVNRILEEYTLVHGRENSRSIQKHIQWTPPPRPPLSFLKVNTDATYCISCKEARLGVVGRDSRGNV